MTVRQNGNICFNEFSYLISSNRYMQYGKILKKSIWMKTLRNQSSAEEKRQTKKVIGAEF